VRIAACVLTHNAFTHQRIELLERTLATLREPGVDVYLVDNNSSDDTASYVVQRGGVAVNDGNTTSGHGTNLCARVLATVNADICVHSDDDMEWNSGWADQLRDWWRKQPDQLALTGCHLEPEYPWNRITGAIEHEGRRALLRHSTGAASWSYRPAHREAIFPIPEERQGWGDVPACHRLTNNGYQIAQIDLASHAGRYCSTWGNPPNHGAELDREKWQL